VAPAAASCYPAAATATTLEDGGVRAAIFRSSPPADARLRSRRRRASSSTWAAAPGPSRRGCARSAAGAGQELEIWGLELDPAAAAAAAGVLDRVLQGPAEDLVARLPGAHFDCVCCNDVLEHLAWPDRVLRDLRRVLKPDGGRRREHPQTCGPSATSGDLVVHGRWSYTDEGVLDRTHLRFYTRASMAELFAAGGYRLLRQEGINPTGAWRFRVVDALTLGRWRDMRYLQFACVARRTARRAPVSAPMDILTVDVEEWFHGHNYLEHVPPSGLGRATAGASRRTPIDCSTSWRATVCGAPSRARLDRGGATRTSCAASRRRATRSAATATRTRWCTR